MLDLKRPLFGSDDEYQIRQGKLADTHRPILCHVMRFVQWPGEKINRRGYNFKNIFVLNRVRVSNPQWHPGIPKHRSSPPPPPPHFTGYPVNSLGQRKNGHILQPTPKTMNFFKLRMIFLPSVRRHFEYRAVVALQFFEKISATCFT